VKGLDAVKRSKGLQDVEAFQKSGVDGDSGGDVRVRSSPGWSVGEVRAPDAKGSAKVAYHVGI
jgi:hypothetical protein